MIRLVAFLIAFLIAAAVLSLLLRVARRAGPAVRQQVRGRRRHPSGPRYEFESRYDQAYRKVKGVRGPEEDREGIRTFVETRQGVEAFVEPKTAINPLSVVLVAADGEPRRFQLADDSYLRELARTQGLPIHDAIKEGYPQRMREYLKAQKRAERGPSNPPEEGSSGEGRS